MMTHIVKLENNLDHKAIEEAADLLKSGGLVAFPTETVYGIGANALDSEAVKKIYIAKGRPSDNPLITHIGHQSDLSQYVTEIPKSAQALMKAFWPGPLTLIFKKQPSILDATSGGLDTVAIRMPSNPIFLRIIRESGIPIAAPSANISGKPSPTHGSHVVEDLNGRVDMIIDGGPVDIGLESTVLDVTQEVPIILRPGSITKEMLESVVGKVTLDPHLKEESHAPKSPGMKYKHYAPKGHLTVYKGNEEMVIDAINEATGQMTFKGHKAGVIAVSEHLSAYKCETVIDIGSETNEREIASNLFKVLRDMDALEVEYIYTRAFTESEIGVATMNRLMKAAGNNLIVL